MVDDLTTYSLIEAAAMICGKDSGIKDPALWVRRKIAAGQFGAIKVGRTYRMTAANIRDARESLAVQPKIRPNLQGLTPTSARRRGLL